MINPIFSIIIPLFNKQDYIAIAVNSILTQNFSDVEIIIVDDGSTDDSVSRVSSIKSSKIHIHVKENGGPASARNYGVLYASGEWIIFLDADDVLEPGSLQTIYKTICKIAHCDFFCFNHYVVNNGVKTLYSSKYTDGYLYNSFFSWCIERCMPRAGASVIRREIVKKYPFKEYLRRYEDAESLFEIMRNVRIYRCSTPVMSYCVDASSSSHPLADINADFIGHLDMKGKSMWEQYALWQLYLQGLDLYPQEMNRLYDRKELRTWKIKFADRIIKIMKEIDIL